jgi:branched-chain amino acid transport system substrate-binding protein
MALALLLSATAGCTGGRTPGPTPSGPGPTTASPSPTGPPLMLDVVAATDTVSDQGADDRSYLEGMQFAIKELNAAGGVSGRPLELRSHDDGGDPGRAAGTLATVLDLEPTAILYVGPGEALESQRTRFAEAKSPVILLGGDLYTSSGLFPQAFQTSIPWEWQAHVLARYLVVDRRAKRIGYVGFGPSAEADADVAGQALSYWGGHLESGATLRSLDDLSPAVEAAQRSDALILEAGPHAAGVIWSAIKAAVPHPPRVVASSGLLQIPGPEGLPSGTTACYTYTWAGWAKPIPRVAEFIQGFRAMFGHNPAGFEQEGYDAVRAMAVALAKTKGGGGRALVTALEGVHETFSSFPVELGPDDHVFLPRDELGLFATPGPAEHLDPWQKAGARNWRALLRTFTYDGERDNMIDRDRPIFFPGWKAPQPGPEYWKSRYGITTRPSDPVH